MELEGRRTHSTSAFKPSSASRTTRDEVVRLPIYGRDSKEAVRAPSPQHLGPIEPNKPSEKEAHPRTNLKPAAFRPMLAFRSVFHFDWCSVSTVAFAHLAPDPSGALVSLGGHVSSSAHAHLVLMLHSMFKGDRSGTYRARTSGTNPPWQESCSVHDFEALDAK